MFSHVDAYMNAFMELMEANFDLGSDAEYNLSLATGTTPPPPVTSGGQTPRPAPTPAPPVDVSNHGGRHGGSVSDPQGLQALKENRGLMIDMIIQNDKLEDCRPLPHRQTSSRVSRNTRSAIMRF